MLGNWEDLDGFDGEGWDVMGVETATQRRRQ